MRTPRDEADAAARFAAAIETHQAATASAAQWERPLMAKIGAACAEIPKAPG